MTNEVTVIVEEVRKMAGRVDAVEQAINQFKDIPPSDIKKTNDLVIGVGGLSDQIQSLREELDAYKKDTDQRISDAVKKEIAPLLKTMQKIEKKGKVTINEVRHNWLAFLPWKKGVSS